MLLEEKANLLLAELDKIEISKELSRAFNELAYTAYETEVIEIKMYEPDIIIKLVKLAEKFGCDLPNEFIM